MHTQAATHLPAGTYFVGDLCYVLTEETWQTLSMFPGGAESWTDTVEDQTLWMGCTAHGDGSYDDQEGYTYGVDSGTLGVIPTAACDLGCLRDTLRHTLGRVVDYPAPFTVVYEAGQFVFGHVVIETRADAQKSDDAP